MLYLAEASRRFGCTEIFKEPSKFAWSDYYEEHFIVPYQKIILVTNKRVTLLQVSEGCLSYDTPRMKKNQLIFLCHRFLLFAVFISRQDG